MKNILIAGPVGFSDEQIQTIENLGFTVYLQPHESAPLAQSPDMFDAVICNRLFDHHDLTLFIRLKWIHLSSSGSEQLPVAVLRQAGIEVYPAKNVYSVPIAEWVILKILELYKQSRIFMEHQLTHRWEKQRGLLELDGKTAVLVGFGDIAREIAKRLRAFGVKTIGVGRRLIDTQYCDEYILQDRIDWVLPTCDILISTLPANESTHHFFNEERLSKCKSGSIFINVSRGAVVDESALLSAIQSGHLQGAALDVFFEEPLPVDHPFWSQPNILVTPHNAFVSEQNTNRLFALVYNNLERFAAC